MAKALVLIAILAVSMFTVQATPYGLYGFSVSGGSNLQAEPLKDQSGSDEYTIFLPTQAKPAGLGGFGALGGYDLQIKLLEYRFVCLAQSGSDEGFQKAITSLGSAMECVSQNLDMAQLSQDLDLIRRSSENRKSLLDNYCPRFNESVPCFEDVLEGAAMCSGGNTDNIAATKNLYRKIIHNFIGLVCKDNGRIIAEMESSYFSVCLDNIRESSVRCKVSEFVMQRTISQYGEEECKDIKRARDCLAQAVNTCQVTTILDILDALYQPTVEVADCKRFSSFAAVNDSLIASNQNETVATEE